jgi:cell cycle checkpoint protein
LIETLQIFGINETNRWTDSSSGGVTSIMARGGPGAAFDNRILGTPGICKLSYSGLGSTFNISIEETGILTTCELTIYEPDLHPDIPFDKNAVVQKIIMKSNLLYDAINELSSTSPTRITMTASVGKHFSLSSDGPHGSATVEFSPDPQLLETFEVSQQISNTYKFDLIKATSRAMGMASKVSIRVDQQGVLSLQFLIELDNGLKNFIDFRFIPYLEEEEDDDDDRESDPDFED